MAQTYGQRPSAFLGLRAGSAEALEWDLGVFTFGRWVETRLQDRDKPPLERLLRNPDAPARPVTLTQMRALGEVIDRE